MKATNNLVSKVNDSIKCYMDDKDKNQW